MQRKSRNDKTREFLLKHPWHSLQTRILLSEGKKSPGNGPSSRGNLLWPLLRPPHHPPEGAARDAQENAMFIQVHYIHTKNIT